MTEKLTNSVIGVFEFILRQINLSNCGGLVELSTVITSLSAGSSRATMVISRVATSIVAKCSTTSGLIISRVVLPTALVWGSFTYFNRVRMLRIKNTKIHAACEVPVVAQVGNYILIGDKSYRCEPRDYISRALQFFPFLSRIDQRLTLAPPSTNNNLQHWVSASFTTLVEPVVIAEAGALVQASSVNGRFNMSESHGFVSLTSLLYEDTRLYYMQNLFYNCDNVCHHGIVNYLCSKSVHVHNNDVNRIRLAIAMIDKEFPGIHPKIRMNSVFSLFMDNRRRLAVVDSVANIWLTPVYYVFGYHLMVYNGVVEFLNFMRSTPDPYDPNNPQPGIFRFEEVVVKRGREPGPETILQGPFIPSVECATVKSFEMSLRFSVMTSQGVELTPEGIVPTVNVVRRHYRTVLGWHVPNSGCVYHYSTASLFKALSYRLLGKRDHEDTLLPRTDQVGATLCILADQMFGFPNAIKFALWSKLPGNTIFDRISPITTICSRYLDHLLYVCVRYRPTVPFDRYMAVKAYAEAPHVKRPERLEALSVLLSDVIQFHELNDGFRVEGKHKNLEVAKPGKASRMYGSLGATRLLHHPFVAEWAKDTLGDKYVFYENRNRFEFQVFNSPRPDKLSDLFNEVIEQDVDGDISFKFVCYSDDSFFQVVTPTGRYGFNVDISSNDVTNTSGAWVALLLLLDGIGCPLEYLSYAVELATSPLEVRDREAGVYMRLNNTRIAEWSGQDFTTILNNSQSMMLAHALFNWLVLDPTDLTPTSVSAACAVVGVTVTCDKWEVFEDLQFLKHSPVYTNHGYLAVLNGGVIVKKFGTCQGPLEYPLIPKNLANSPYSVKVKAFLTPIVTGLSKQVKTPLIEILRVVFPSNSQHSVPILYQLENISSAWDMSYAEVDLFSYCARYRIEPADYLDACELYRNCGPGSVIQHEVFQRMLEKDYGLTSVFE